MHFGTVVFPLIAQNGVEERHFYDINNGITESGRLKEQRWLSESSPELNVEINTGKTKYKPAAAISLPKTHVPVLFSLKKKRKVTVSAQFSEELKGKELSGVLCGGNSGNLPTPSTQLKYFPLFSLAPLIKYWIYLPCQCSGFMS